jgi:hypothetical protein
MTGKDLVTVAKYGNLQEASLLKAMLEEQGIPAYLVGAEASGMLWFVGTALGGVQLQVEVHDQEQALKLLAELEERNSPEDAEPWICPQCGSTVDAGFDVCWSCGLNVDQAPTKVDLSASPAQSLPSLDEGIEQDESVAETQGKMSPEAVEDMASRALKAAIIGLGTILLSFYALHLLIQLSNQELNPKSLKKYYLSTGIIVLTFAWWTAFFLSF